MSTHRTANWPAFFPTRRYVGLWLLPLVAGFLAQQAAAENGYRLTPGTIALIPPGTVIDRQAPENWSHMILKSQPRVVAGDIKQVNATSIQLASRFFTALLANVQSRPVPGGGVEFVLARVAGGVGTRIGNRDTIVDPDSHARLGAQLGILAPRVLSEMHTRQAEVPVIVRSAQLAIFDTPIALRVGPASRWMVLRYAVFVDPATGTLETLAWLIERNDRGEYLGLRGSLQWLPPNKLVDCGLHVDRSQFNFLGIPSSTAFSCLSIPQGKLRLNAPPQAAQLLAKPTYSAEEAAVLDRWMRSVVRQAAAARRPPETPRQR